MIHNKNDICGDIIISLKKILKNILFQILVSIPTNHDFCGIKLM